MGKCIGIDLGTTNSAVSVCEASTPKIIINSEENVQLPLLLALLKKVKEKWVIPPSVRLL